MVESADGVDEEVVLARHAHGDFRFGHGVGEVYDKALVLVFDLLGHRHVGHTQAVYAVVAEDAGVHFLELADAGLHLLEFVGEFFLFYKVGYDKGEEPYPYFAEFFIELSLLLAESRNLVFNPLFLADDTLCRMPVIVEEHFCLVLPYVGGIREDFSCHWFSGLLKVKGLSVCDVCSV